MTIGGAPSDAVDDGGVATPDPIDPTTLTTLIRSAQQPPWTERGRARRSLAEYLEPYGFRSEDIPVPKSHVENALWVLGGWEPTVRRSLAISLAAGVAELATGAFEDRLVDEVLEAAKADDREFLDVAVPRLAALVDPAGPAYEDLPIETPGHLPVPSLRDNGAFCPLPDTSAATHAARRAGRAAMHAARGATAEVGREVLYALAELRLGGGRRWPVPEQPFCSDTLWDFLPDPALKLLAAVLIRPARRRVQYDRFYARDWPDAVNAAIEDARPLMARSISEIA